MIYLDNAATSWPKPPCVAEAMVRFMNEVGANPGRAGHRLAVESGRLVYEAREAVARLFNVADPLRVVFCSNVTEAINTCLYGYLQPSDHVITGSMEHNSVMRPLRTLEKTGVEISVAACSNDGCLNPDDIEKLIKPNTKLVAVNHASNVVGTLVPLRDIGAICRYHGLLLLVDTAQSAGTYPLDMQVDLIDLLCFTGHKSLYGPTGTGGVIMGDRVDIDLIRPFKQGGTGSNSEHEEQPSFLPDIFESGTPNVAGLSGLAAGVAWLIDKGVMEIRLHEMQLG